MEGDWVTADDFTQDPLKRFSEFHKIKIKHVIQKHITNIFRKINNSNTLPKTRATYEFWEQFEYAGTTMPIDDE